MSIKTIEERLKAKADYLGEERAKADAIKVHVLREALSLMPSDAYSDPSKKAILKMDGWALAEVINTAMVKLRQAEALDELRSNLMNMQDQLNEILENDYE